MGLIDYLKLPNPETFDNLDDPRATLWHRQVILEKGFLKKIYRDFYQRIARSLSAGPDGPVIELGSGGGIIKDVMPRVTTSDILFLPHVDLCFRADQSPFKDESVSAFVMLNVFHHVKDTKSFLGELDRCLKRHGKIIMIEPANSVWGRCIYQNLHHEVFDPSAEWGVEGDGALSCGNGALPWIVFQRDAEKFRDMFPRLKLKRMSPFAPFRYLLSGGVSFRQLLPTSFYGLVKAVEWLLRPFNRWLSMFYYIEIEKE